MSKNPTSLLINKVRLSRRFVIIDYHNGSASLSVSDPDNPLPEFKAAVAALLPLILAICHLPEDYGINLVPSGLTITEKGMVTIQGKKSFDDASGPLNIATPLRLLETPEEEGTYSPPLTDKQNALIDEVIEQAKRYILGERAQGTLFVEEEENDLPDGLDEPLEESKELPFEPKGEPVIPVKKSRKKKEPAESVAE